MRPLTRIEQRAEMRRNWLRNEENKAREERGVQGQMEFWIRVTRSRIAKEAKRGRTDALSGYALVNRLVLIALEKRAAGDKRIWDDLLTYAQAVVDRNTPTS